MKVSRSVQSPAVAGLSQLYFWLIQLPPPGPHPRTEEKMVTFKNRPEFGTAESQFAFKCIRKMSY